MRVFITGASGFIGRALGERYTADGHEVRGVPGDPLDGGRGSDRERRREGEQPPADKLRVRSEELLTGRTERDPVARPRPQSPTRRARQAGAGDRGRLR
jgi:nucleoside-diphosphate-sugar epimerase